MVAHHFLQQDDVELAVALELPSPWETPIQLDAAEEDGPLEEEKAGYLEGGAGSVVPRSTIPAILPRAVARRMTPGGATRAHMAARAAKRLPVDDLSPEEQVSSKRRHERAPDD